jgi:hypothetical protein
MLSLTYVSSAREQMDEDALVRLLEKVRPKNQALDVTGMLLYSGGNIIQTLEGPAAAVEELFTTISADPRHRGVLALVREEVSERGFPDWSMGFRRLSREEVEPEGFSPFLEEGFADAPATRAAAHHLLETFRESMR